MIEIRPTQVTDLPGLDRLFQDRFGHGLSPDQWRWKYEQSPGCSRSWVAVDERGTGDSGEVLAHAGALAHPARHRDRQGLLWQLVDWVGRTTGAGLRPPLVGLGRGLLRDLPRETDLPWIYGFPSRRHFALGRRVFGYRPLPAIIPLAGELAGLPRAELAKAELPRAEQGSERPRVSFSDHCGDWVEATWEACTVSGVRRTAEFLNWRYHARPDRYYRFYRLERGESPDSTTDDELPGLAVFAFVDRDALATELWLPGSDREAERWLPALLEVAEDLRRSGMERWRFWPGPEGPGPKEPGSGGLGREGPEGPGPVRPSDRESFPHSLAELRLAPQGSRTMGCRGRRGGPDPQSAASGFYYAMGDYDLV